MKVNFKCFVLMLYVVVFSLGVFVYVGYDYEYWISGVMYVLFYVFFVGCVVVCGFVVYKYFNVKKCLVK